MTDENNNWAPPPPPPDPATNDAQWAPPARTPEFTGTPELAGFWIRLLANLCDGIMVGLITLPISIIMTATSDTTNTLLGYLQFLVGFGALAWWMGNQGGSPLRRKLGVLVLDENDGSFIGTQRAVIRIAMSWVSGICLLLGYLSMLWHPRKQTWHDRVAHSIVVRR